jgi:hypothetical protein
MGTRVQRNIRRLIRLLVVGALALATFAPGALGNSVYTVPVTLSFEGSGTYFVHYSFDDTAKGGCTSDTTATLTLSWKDRSSFGDFQEIPRPAASGSSAISVKSGPGTFKVKETETAGDNCSIVVHPSCNGELKAGHDPSGLTYKVPAEGTDDDKDVFTWHSPFKLDRSVHCDGTDDQSGAGFAGGAMKIFNESVASTITAKIEECLGRFERRLRDLRPGAAARTEGVMHPDAQLDRYRHAEGQPEHAAAGSLGWLRPSTGDEATPVEPVGGCHQSRSATYFLRSCIP